MRDLFGFDPADIVQEYIDNGPNHRQMGKIAEILVLLDLTRQGHQADLTNSNGFDIHLIVNGRSFRVQVKGSSRIDAGVCCWACRVSKYEMGPTIHRKKQPLTAFHADILALYHHQLDRIIYRKVPAEGSWNVRLPVKQVQATTAAQSLDATLRALGHKAGK
jgi:hypothetical protein